jgi:hypothetical protein
MLEKLRQNLGTNGNYHTDESMLLRQKWSESLNE